jgi:dynein heavy chain 1, cytosolic
MINQVDLAEFAGPKINPKNPIMLVSAPGFDASYKVELLAKQVNKKYTAVAIGSPEAFGQVDTAIRNAAKSGSWVLCKNVHLAPAWLAELEKKIYNMQLDSNFRLFMTMENNPKVPTTLLRASHVLVFEPPSGIKAALVRSYA